MTTIDPMYTTLPPLGEGLPLQLELREPPSSSSGMDIPTRSRAHLEEANQQQATIAASKASVSNLSSLGTGATLLSPLPTPPRLIPNSPVASRKGSGRMQAMDDSYCDRIRSTRWACILNTDPGDCCLAFELP